MGKVRGIIVAGGAGRLDVIATPIGNIGDLSPRARDCLAAADLVLAEDTRRTATLLAACGITRPLLSLHEHNESQRTDALLARLRRGAVLALVSDAGTPLLSDPGFVLVRAAAAAGLEVRSIAGPSAVTAALAVAGLPTNRFVFEGFLPARVRERAAALTRLAQEPRTLVLFEAPHRIGATLAGLAQAFGAGRSAVLARELTKVHERVYRGTLAELAHRAQADADIGRGEITLVIAGSAGAADSGGDTALLARALPLLLESLPPSRAAAIAARLSGVPRPQAYELAQRLAGNRGGMRRGTHDNDAEGG
ncbi:MAG: 16S rRNA (cytidine(1402)-2'-O)-methyltransferase [Gammaproteobacteria bacterium]|nr:16S rRNA (cytidine(1402)-2'-O)-methyltransferase [Gammaproteobacteria bacterium]